MNFGSGAQHGIPGNRVTAGSPSYSSSSSTGAGSPAFSPSSASAPSPAATGTTRTFGIRGTSSYTTCNPPAQPNVAFYKNKYPLPPLSKLDPARLTIDQFFRLNSPTPDYSTLERAHCYIQWLFPNDMESRTVVSEHYALSPEEAAIFATDPEINRRIEKSLGIFLDFLGFEFRVTSSSSSASSSTRTTPSSTPTSTSKAAAAANKTKKTPSRISFSLRPNPRNFSSRVRDWISHPHNDKRISRLLKFLQIVGLPDVANRIMECFVEQIEKSAAEERTLRRGMRLSNPFVDIVDSAVDHWIPCLKEKELATELFMRAATAAGEQVTERDLNRLYERMSIVASASSAVDDVGTPRGATPTSGSAVAVAAAAATGGGHPQKTADLPPVPPRPAAAGQQPSNLDATALQQQPSGSSYSSAVTPGAAAASTSPSSPRRGHPCKDPRCPCDADPATIGGLPTMPMKHKGYCSNECLNGVRCGGRKHVFAAGDGGGGVPAAASSSIPVEEPKVQQFQPQQNGRRGADDDDDDQQQQSQKHGALLPPQQRQQQRHQEEAERDSCNPDGSCRSCSKRPANPGKALCSACFMSYLRGDLLISAPADADAAAAAAPAATALPPKRKEEEEEEPVVVGGAAAAAAEDERKKKSTTSADAKAPLSVENPSSPPPAAAAAAAAAAGTTAHPSASLFPPLADKCAMCSGPDVLPGCAICDNCSVATAMQLEAYADGWRQNGNVLHKNGLVRFSNEGGLFTELSSGFAVLLRDSPNPEENPGTVYTSAEAMFQANKFLDTNPRVADAIRKAPNSSAATDLARKHMLDERRDWLQIRDRVMLEVLRRKFSQSLHCQRVLAATGGSDIELEGDYLNGNKLGKMLQIIRGEVKKNGIPLFGQALSQEQERWLAASALSAGRPSMFSGGITAPSSSLSRAPAAVGGIPRPGSQSQSRSLGGGVGGGVGSRAPPAFPPRR